MDAVTVFVELISRHGEVQGRHRLQLTPDRPLTLGRGYDCDVIVDDPYVAPHHLRIGRDAEGRLWAEDAGSRNGVYFDGERERIARMTIDGLALVRIGHTHLRIHDGHLAVVPERVDPHVDSVWPRALLALSGVVVMTLLQAWLGDTAEPRFAMYLSATAAAVVALLVWTSGWALTSRLFAGHPWFASHLLIAACGLLGVIGFEALTTYAAFAFSWEWVLQAAFVGYWLLLATVVFLHLHTIGPGHLRLKGAIVGVLALCAIGVQAVNRAQPSAGEQQPAYVQELKPAVFRLREPQPIAAFLADSDRLHTRLDEQRLEQPADDEAQ
jgi:hypothetical protein